MHNASALVTDAWSESGYPCDLGLGEKGSSMKKTILAAALALALPLMLPAWAQAPEQKAEAEKPAEAAKPAPKAKAAKSPRKATVTARRHMDARHCLEQPNNDAIIRCAEEYL